MKSTLFLLSLLSLLFSCNHTAETYDNYVLLVSMDGCRWDYTDIYDTPNFDDMSSEGVRAERVISSFPTKTFPNHYTIATGLYPDHHGLINNSFYAPDLDLTYSIGNREMVENGNFYEGEPIWNTAERQGVLSASFFWVGSEAPIQGMQPEKWKPYDGSVPFEARVDTVIKWLKKPLENRPRLILLYFQQPDGVGHDFGPVHQETARVVEEMDRILGQLRKKLKKLPYGDKINLIVTSDHGMGEISPDRYINVYDYIEHSWMKRIIGGNPVYLVEPLEEYLDTIVLKLNGVEGITAWKKDEVPAHLNYGTHPRIPEVIIVADSGWSVGIKSEANGYMGGAHGYDSRNTDMHHIFYAEGPAFKQEYVHPPFENVDIYPLIAHLLDLEPALTDGKLDDVRGMLK